MPQAIPAAAAWVAGAVATTGAAIGITGAASGWLTLGAYYATSAALYGAAGAAINAAIAQNTEQTPDGGVIKTKADANYPREMVIGTRAVAGSVVYWNLSGAGTGKGTLHYVLALSDHISSKIKRVWANGRLMAATDLEHGVKTEITEFASGGPRAYVTFYDGRWDQAPDAGLVSASGGKWTSSHKLRGVACVVVQMGYDSDTMTSPASWLFELEGGKFYDRRLDTTAGGSGSHRLDDEATWAYTENPAVIWDHYRQGIYRNSKKWWGLGRPADDDLFATFAANANLCDEDVTLKASGTQKRYALNGVISAMETHAQIARDVAAAMGGRVIDVGGRARIIGGAAQTPVMTLTDDDLVTGEQVSYVEKAGFDELVNRIEGSYADPGDMYNPATAPPLENATYLAEDGGVEHTATPAFRFETNGERVQRLQTIFLEDARRMARLRATFPLRAVKLEPGDWFTFESDRLGFPDGKDFVVFSRTLNPDLTVTVFAAETDASVTAWDENDAADISLPDPPDYGFNLIEVPEITVEAATISGVASSIPALRVAWTAPTDERVAQILIEAEPSSGDRITGVFDIAEGDVVLPTLDGITYAVRARFLAGNRKSDWCDAEGVETDSDYSVGAAESVPWSGVTDDGARPDDNADVTASNTAAAITGQGTGATANNLAGLNTTDNTNLNTVLTDTRSVLVDNFAQDGHHWQTAFGGAPGAASAPGATTYATVTGVGRVARVTPNAYMQPKGVLLPAVGRRYLCVARLRVQTDASGGGSMNPALAMNGLDSSWANGTANATASTPSGYTASYTGLTAATGWVTIGRVFTCASLSTYDAAWRPRVDLVRSGGSAGAFDLAWFKVFDVTDVPVGRSLVDLIRADGSTAVTEGAVVTASGTAAAISGQGNFATNNFYVQGTEPSSPVDGWWWADTASGLLKVRVSGVWEEIADITPSTSTILKVTPSTVTPSNSGAASASLTTSTCTLTISGGTEPYEVYWRDMGYEPYETGVYDVFTIDDVEGTAVAWDGTVDPSGEFTAAVWQARVQDATGAVAYTEVIARLTNTSWSP